MQNSDTPQHSNTSFDISLVLPKGPDGSVHSYSEAEQDIHSFFKKFPIRYEIIDCLSTFEGIEKAQGRYIFCLDALLSTPLVEVFTSLQTFHEYVDIQFIFGDRNHPKKKPRGMASKKQKIFEKFISHWTQKNIKKLEPDPFCPYVAFRTNQKKAVLEIMTLDDYYYAIKIKKWALQSHLKMTHQPIHWKYGPYQASWKDILKTIRLVR